MSTRCTINFGYGPPSATTRPIAKVYRHSDGYPEGVVPDLADFFDAVESHTTDTRFNDPSYLAAKYVVWQASEYARSKDAPLDFLSVGVLLEDPSDIRWTYWLDCDAPSGRPTVYQRPSNSTTWQRATAHDQAPTT